MVADQENKRVWGAMTPQEEIMRGLEAMGKGVIIIIEQLQTNGIIFLQVLLNPSIQLSEGWKCCCSHPHNKILLLT